LCAANCVLTIIQSCQKVSAHASFIHFDLLCYFPYRSLLVAGVGFLIIMFFNAFAGIIMFARYYGCDPMLAGVSFPIFKIIFLIKYFISSPIIAGQQAGQIDALLYTGYNG